MTKKQIIILRVIGIIFFLTAAILLFRDFGNNNWPLRIMRYALLFSGLYFIHITLKDTNPSEDSPKMGPYGVMFLCTPTILGVLAVIIAQFFRPGHRMPLETMTDRFFANLLVAGVPVALIGLPLVAFAIFKGASLIWREGLRSSTSKFVIVILVVAIGASTLMITKTIEYRGQYKHDTTHETVK
jgi:hypothetical protein